MHLRTHKKIDATSSEQNKTIKIKPKKKKKNSWRQNEKSKPDKII